MNDKFSTHYKIKDEWDVPFHQYQDVIPNEFESKVTKDDIEINGQELEGVYKKLFNSFNDITIDKEEALSYLKELLENPELVNLKDKRDRYGRFQERVFNMNTYRFYEFIVENFDKHKFFLFNSKLEFM